MLSARGASESALSKLASRAVDLVDPAGEAVVLSSSGLEALQLLSRLLQLSAQALLSLGGARHVAAEGLDGRAHIVELAPQALALAACLLGLALQPLAVGPGLLVAGAAGVLDVAAQALHLRARLVERPARVGQLGLEPRAGPFEVREALLGPSGLLELRLRGGKLELLERGLGRRLVEGPKGDDRARGQAVVVELGLSVEGGLDPVHHRAVAAAQRRQGSAARRDDLQGLEKAVELEALAHAHRHESHRHLELLAVLTAHHRRELSTALGQVVGKAQRRHERPPDHALGGPAEELLGRAAPARDRAVAIGEDEAGVDELAEQLFDCLRGGGIRGGGVLGHTGSVIGRPGAGWYRSGTCRGPTCVQGGVPRAS